STVPLTSTVPAMITIASLMLILLLTLSLVGSLLMCESKEKRRLRKQRKLDEAAVEKWEQEYKIATGKDVNDEPVTGRPEREESDSHAGCLLDSTPDSAFLAGNKLTRSTTGRASAIANGAWRRRIVAPVGGRM
ncbi:hypothetical protein PFISCL1PPCAC_17332, partial [Pristionchus fissidentatus]